MHRFPRIVAVMIALACANDAAAHDYTLQRLRIDHPFARATPPGARSGGIYMTIENGGTAVDRLLRVASPAAASVELHSMTMDGNVMRMRAITGLDIAPGAKVTLGSSGYHVMLVGLASRSPSASREPVADGERAHESDQHHVVSGRTERHRRAGRYVEGGDRRASASRCRPSSSSAVRPTLPPATRRAPGDPPLSRDSGSSSRRRRCARLAASRARTDDRCAGCCSV